MAIVAVKKRTPGRKALPKAAKRSKRVQVLVKDEELAEIERRVEKRSITVSDWGREAILAKLKADPEL
jgi:hypothetical protein